MPQPSQPPNRTPINGPDGSVSTYWQQHFTEIQAALTSRQFYLPAVDSAPTFTPELRAGFIPVVYDRTSDDLYAYTAAAEWEKTGLGDVIIAEQEVTFSGLASGGTVALFTPDVTKERWKIREMFISGAGTNFSGGNRDLEITDGTTQWSVIPHSQLGSLAAHRWGETELPFPSTAANLTVASTAGNPIYAKYSGGTTDDSAGACTLILTLERTT